MLGIMYNFPNGSAFDCTCLGKGMADDDFFPATTWFRPKMKDDLEQL